jgi:CRP/FNR family transcriptional regulator, cyclic AMP receptor protein
VERIVSVVDRAYVRLLEVEPDLGRDLSRAQLAHALEHTVAPVLDLSPGRWEPAERELLQRHPFGAIVIDGILVREVVLAARVAAQLFGPGEVTDPWCRLDQSLPATIEWTAASPVRLAVLDDHVLVVARAHPHLAARLFERVARSQARTAQQQAIGQLPRIEQRVLALFWHLAGEWGRVSGAGIVLPLQLTHATIGRLVGARRPTVSLALKELAAEGLLVRRADDSWLLRAGSDRTLSSGREEDDEPPDVRLLEEPANPPPAPVPTVRDLDRLHARVASVLAAQDQRTRRSRQAVARAVELAAESASTRARMTGGADRS